MDNKLVGLLGVIGAFASLDAAQATIATNPETALHAQTYADLLSPIPNAAATLKAVDQAGAGMVQVAENAHHHHHHSYRRERTVIVAPRRHHHHHHHHHHQSIKIER